MRATNSLIQPVKSLPTDRSMNFEEYVDLWVSCVRVSPELRSQTEAEMIRMILLLSADDLDTDSSRHK